MILSRKNPRLAGVSTIEAAAPVPNTSWLAWTTLAEGHMLLRVHGSSFHQDTLQMLGGGAHPREPRHPLIMATLRVETTGEYAGAVRVFVGDREVGSIPTDAAAAYRAVVEEVEATNRPATCRGRVIGGGLSHEADFWLSFGFELLQPTKPRARTDHDPFLPATGFFRVQLDEGQEQRMDEMLHSKAKSKNLDISVHLRFEPPACRVEVVGVAVGALDCDARELTLIEEAVAAGFPPTAWARIARKRDRPTTLIVEAPRSY